MLFRSQMTSKQKAECHAIIHTASAGCAGIGAGLAQLPGSDNAAIVPIQITMTISLGRVFGKTFTESTALATIGTMTTSTVGRALSQALVGWIPGVGNAINAVTAASVTETLGWLLVEEFDKGNI